MFSYSASFSTSAIDSKSDSDDEFEVESSTENKTLIGYSCQFVSPPKELQFECAVCTHIVRKPHLVSCCGHRFCAKCIEQVKRKRKKCPVCKKKFTTFRDRLLHKTLRDRLVICSNAESGCQWTGALCDFDSHFSNCEFTPAKCPNGCDAYGIQRLSVDAHVRDECPLTLLQCSICKKKVLRKDMLSHRRIFAEDHIAKLQSQVKNIESESTENLKEVKDEFSEVMHLLLANQDLPKLMRRMKPSKLCIQNLPSYADKHMIKSYCGVYGTVKKIDIFKHLSIAVVEFEDSQSVKKLLEEKGDLSEECIIIDLWGKKLSLSPVCN